MTDITPKLRDLFGDRLKLNEPMAKHVNFRIGGPAHWLVEAKSEAEITEAVQLARAADVPVFVLGGGSNVLVNDVGYDGLVVKIAMRAVRVEGETLVAEAGAISSAVARTAADAGLAGLEWAISLPGTIGGAVRGNAGCFGGETADYLVSARVLRGDAVVDVPAAALEFAYRESALKHSDDIVLSATFHLKKGTSAELKEHMADFLATRKSTQPLYAGSAGCVFKNLELKGTPELDRLRRDADIPEAMRNAGRISAGWLVDQLGLKGKKIGAAQISAEHGNFIVNLGAATVSDVVQLIALAKTEARNRFGIQLQEEIGYLGF